MHCQIGEAVVMLTDALQLFSWCVIRLVFASLLLNFDIELADEACDWPQQKSYFIWRTRPLMCRIRPAEKKTEVA